MLGSPTAGELGYKSSAGVRGSGVGVVAKEVKIEDFGRDSIWGVIDEGEGVVVVDVPRDVVGESGGDGSFVVGELSHEKCV